MFSHFCTRISTVRTGSPADPQHSHNIQHKLTPLAMTSSPTVRVEDIHVGGRATGAERVRQMTSVAYTNTLPPADPHPERRASVRARRERCQTVHIWSVV